MFTGQDKNDRIGLQKKQISKLQRNTIFKESFYFDSFNKTTKTKETKYLPFTISSQELFLFPDGIGIFSITFNADELTLNYASDLINQARSFQAKLNYNGRSIQFHDWIGKQILCGIPLVGEKLEVDEYSGSKFRVYSVFDLAEEKSEQERDHLLYEIGSSSPIGSATSNGRLKPAESYYQEILKQKISAFANYDGLAMLDSFTVIGKDNYASINDERAGYIPHHQWNRAYFGIYVFNLYVRYNLFKYNTQFLLDPVKYREKFQDFLNLYNFTHISFNFLPNLIFTKIRTALGIDAEIEKFEKRLGNLAASIQENQEKRQAFLLTLISVISGWTAAKDIMNQLVDFRVRLGWNALPYYSLLSVVITSLIIILIEYLFPLHAQKIRKRISRYWKKQMKSKK
jgi:hypothetical protein